MKGDVHMLRIAICDDETKARDALRFQLEKIIDEETEEIVYEFSSGINAEKWLRKYPGQIDLLFLDVEMDGMNGMETAEKIRTFDENLLIVFVTGYQDYVFDGYRAGALDYVMKPVEQQRLREVYDRAKHILKERMQKTFIVKNSDGVYRFPYEDILYFYSDRRLVNLVTARGTYSFYEKLDVLEEKLGNSFVRIHQRYLVNGKKVLHMGRTSLDILGQDRKLQTLPISRGLKETAAAKLARMILADE